MIAKISSTENLGGALGYNFKKVEKGEANVLLAQGLYHPREVQNKKDGVPLFAQSAPGRETIR